MAKLFEWKCSKCNKEISSTHKGQFEYNKEQHIESHERHQEAMQRRKPKSPLSEKEKFLKDNELEG